VGWNPGRLQGVHYSYGKHVISSEMPLSGVSRWYLSAALVHLAVAGALILADRETAVLTVRWDALVWLLLVGFVGCTTAGLSLHLFPTMARRLVPRRPASEFAFLTAEASVIVGTSGFYLADSPSGLPGAATVAGLLLLASAGLILSRFVSAALHPQMVGPGDVVTVPLFLIAWGSAAAAGALFAVSGWMAGPGLGWWLAAVHLFVLGHATLLVAAVVLRMVPRSVGADAPKAAAVSLAILATLGAGLVPVGMLLTPGGDSLDLTLWATPEVGFAGGLTALLVYLGIHARTLRRPWWLHLSSALCLLFGGGVGLWMVTRSNFALVVTHALVNILGFVGLMILVMWFGMIAPFQRISHAWTRRMLWILSASWLIGVAALAAAGAAVPGVPDLASTIGGGLLLGVAIAWGVGTIPVLFPKVHPLPGLTSEEIRALRERWSHR